MIQERARVLRIDGNTAWVRCESQSGCQRCAEGRGCGGGLFSMLLRRRLQELPVRMDGDLKVDDWILLGLDPAVVQNAAFLVYGLPLLLLLMGAVLGDQAGGDLPAFIGAAVGLFAGFPLGNGFARRLIGQSRIEPVLLRRLNPVEPCPATCPEPRKD